MVFTRSFYLGVPGCPTIITPFTISFFNICWTCWTCAWIQFRTRASESQGNSATRDCTESPIHSAMTHPSKPIGTSLWYQTPGTTAIRLWARTILHWASYSWHWHEDIIFVWRKHDDISPCIDNRVNTSCKRTTSSAGTQFRMRLKVTPPPSIVPRVLTTWPWPTHPSKHGLALVVWGSCQIRKIAGCACAGNAGNVFPATDFKGNH